tara:strand:+ start:210 stop:335 length:126 start_codon:yes stop_codon:yes gene_type:complete
MYGYGYQYGTIVSSGTPPFAASVWGTATAQNWGAATTETWG